MKPEELADKLVNSHSLGLPLFEAQDEIAEVIKAAVLAERERCAKIVADPEYCSWKNNIEMIRHTLVTLIRSGQ